MTKKQVEVAERTLPHNLEAERSVLGSILLHNGGYEAAARIVKADDFYRLAHKMIFSAIARLLERPGGEVDLVMLKEDLNNRGELDESGGPSYVGALVDGVPRGINVAHYAGIVKEKSMLRAIVFLSNKVLARAYDGEDQALDILAAADRGIVDLQTGVTHGRMKSLATTSSDTLDWIEWREQHRGELLGVPTGFAEIDDLTLGWQRGNMIIVAARPSIGKTTFVMNSGVNLATQLRPDKLPYQVAAFSMEMKRRQLETRILAMLSGIPISNIQTGTIVGDREWGLLSTAVGTMAESGMHIDDTASHTVQSIRRECRRLKSEKGLDLVIIDYVQLMAGSLERRGATRNEEMTQISRQLKLLFDELDVPGIVLSQLNRGGAGRTDPTPKLSDLRESGSLEQDADVVAFLHRKNHRVDGHTWFIAEKDRNGPTGTANLTLLKDIGRFENGGEQPVLTQDEKKAEDQDAKVAAIIRRRARGRH